MFDGVPTMYMRLLNFPGLARFDLSSLRLCTVGGQTMPVSKMEEVEQRFGCRLLELWGMTELGGLGITHPHNGPRKLGAIGVVLPLSEAKVVDIADATRSVPRGETGELMFRGPLVMDGYHGDAEATRDTITPDGWLHTGDVVRQDADGYFYLVDRKKDVIVSAGYKIYPAEVERVIAQHPAVAMVAVAPMRDEMKGHVAKAFVVLRHGMQATAEDIIAQSRTDLAPYKIPKTVEFMLDLPKTSTGKILRRALADNSPAALV
jgi:long-chain acyl-CoA synthetase